MNKYYFFTTIFLLVAVSLNAQFTDDMESYTEGQPIFQDHWTDWGCGGGAGCAIMSSSAQARSGSLSGLIPDDGTTDAVLDLGNKIFGEWSIQFFMYIPSDKEAYFNLQGTVPIGAGEWSVGNIHFNKDNLDPSRGFIDYGPNTTGDETYFDFTHDAWIRVVMHFDITGGMSAATWQFAVDNNVVVDGVPFQDEDGNVPTCLGGITFFSINALTNEFYVDDLQYGDGPLIGINDFKSKGFLATPNPVVDVLKVSSEEIISEITISNVLGQIIERFEVNSSNFNVHMEDYLKGIYFLKVKTNTSEGSVKIIK